MIRIATDDQRPHNVQRPEYQDVKDSKQGEGDEVEEDQVHPGYVDLDVVRVLSESFSWGPIKENTLYDDDGTPDMIFLELLDTTALFSSVKLHQRLRKFATK